MQIPLIIYKIKGEFLSKKNQEKGRGLGLVGVRVGVRVRVGISIVSLRIDQRIKESFSIQMLIPLLFCLILIQP
jgi:hypothetical protein